MPSKNTEQRKLAVIMFTDVVGYSAPAQRDEALALELLEALRFGCGSGAPRTMRSNCSFRGDSLGKLHEQK